jgi:hypothetical protein
MLVKIEESELNRLRNIEKAALAFKELVEQTGTEPAIAALLNKKKGR